jgi:mono/diheme cytochrome c family protein
MRVQSICFSIATLAAGVVLVDAQTATQSKPAQPKSGGATFESTIPPVFNKSCGPCHNDRMASGGLNLAPFTAASSVMEHRDDWERILQKIRTGEMPPKGMPKPPAEQLDAIAKFVHDKWEEADAKIPPDPGRVTARRLNRTEYSNTVRDLLGVDFRAERDFPTDDSGYGFDNIGDVLTISPVLMEKYVSAAERIAARAIGADPLPKKPLNFEYATKDKNLRRLDFSTVEATHRVDWDGEYVVRIGLPGERAADAKPVSMAIYMDGKKLTERMVEMKPSGLVYFNPYSEEEFRLLIPEGDHTFRVAFENDPFVKGMTRKDAYDQKKNKTINSILFIGPYPAKVEKASRKKILTCDPNTGGTPCVTQIVSTLARRAYRRPVTKTEVDSLLRFVALAKTEGQSVEQGIQLAIQAMLVSPHFLFRIEKDTTVDVSKAHPISETELASRLSYCLWSSMPDDELLTLAESKKLRASLDAQVKRMLDDPRSSAFADNFAGQWLETRNLDSVKPDPQKFPEWGPELRDAMKQETRLFFEAVLRENRPVTDFLDAKYTFLNEQLAKHYGIEGVTGPDFRKVELTTPQRGGVLTHGSVLTVSSYPTRTSPVIRGKYVLQNILGTPPPPPPPDVPAIDEASVGTAGSMRQQLEKHRANAVCASCHSRMDVLGFGLENYDATGKWRTMDGKFAVDPGGTLPNGKSFTTPAELRTLLSADLDEFSRCLTEKMLTYSLGRGLERFDRKTVDDINKKLAASDYKFQTIIYEIVRSLPFQNRRGETVKTEAKTKEVAQR